MTTARADVLAIASAIDKDGDSAPAVAAFGPGGTVTGVAGDAELLAAASSERKVLVSAVGGHIWLAFSGNATAEPRGLVTDGNAVLVKLAAGQSLRVAAAALA